MRFYLDCEFNGFGGKLISMALVPETDDKPLYMIFPYGRQGVWKDWVKESVIPILKADPLSKKYAQDVNGNHTTTIRDYFRSLTGNDLKEPVQIVADWPDDISYFCKALMAGPGMMPQMPPFSFIMDRFESWPEDGTIPIEGAVRHNALHDARVLKWAIQDNSVDNL